MSVREKALSAAYEADAPRRAEEAIRRARAEERDAEVARQSEAHLRRARRKINSVLHVGVAGWEAVESHPTWCVLRDPDDGSRRPIALLVTSFYADDDKQHVYYAPYAGYMGRDHVGIDRGGATGRWIGPEVTDMLSLGRAIQGHEHRDAEVNASMPDHLP